MSSGNNINNILNKRSSADIAVAGNNEDENDYGQDCSSIRHHNKKMKSATTALTSSPNTDTTVSTTTISIIPSLQQLSSIAVQNYILLQRKRIPKEVSRSFKSQRSSIRKQLRQLEIEKKTLMCLSMAKLEEDIEQYRKQQEQQMKQNQQDQQQQQQQQKPIISGGSSNSSNSGNSDDNSSSSSTQLSKAAAATTTTTTTLAAPGVSFAKDAHHPQITTLCILSERRKILRDAEKYCRDHKLKLITKLREIQNEKRLILQQRLTKFTTTTQQLALLHLSEVKGAPNLFCSKCNYFYKSPDWCANNKNNNNNTKPNSTANTNTTMVDKEKTLNSSSQDDEDGSSSSSRVSSCEWCSICPKCFRKEEEDNDDKLRNSNNKTTTATTMKKKRKFGSLGILDSDDNDRESSTTANGDNEEEYYVSEEQEDWPSPNGYVDCWLCGQRYCNKSFEMDHYLNCRKNYSSRCGFRRHNKYHCSPIFACKVTPGHCGKKLKPHLLDSTSNSGEWNYCRWCTTLYCNDCAPKCKCWDAHCSSCVGPICTQMQNMD